MIIAPPAIRSAVKQELEESWGCLSLFDDPYDGRHAHSPSHRQWLKRLFSKRPGQFLLYNDDNESDPARENPTAAKRIAFALLLARRGSRRSPHRPFRTQRRVGGLSAALSAPPKSKGRQEIHDLGQKKGLMHRRRRICLPDSSSRKQTAS